VLNNPVLQPQVDLHTSGVFRGGHQRAPCMVAECCSSTDPLPQVEPRCYRPGRQLLQHRQSPDKLSRRPGNSGMQQLLFQEVGKLLFIFDAV